jgi:pyruvate dehydrogenase E2 component (dihydrolipoamide acetyltransferase)
MAVEEVRLPELGENIESGDVIAVLVAAGEWIDKDQSIIEVESEKAALEIPSPVAGVVKEIRVHVGDRIAVGQVIVVLDTGGAKETGVRKAPEPSREEKPAVTLRKPSEVDEAKAEGRRGEAPSAPPTVPESSAERAPDVVAAGPAVRRLARELGVDVHRVRGSGPGGRISAEDVKEEARRLVSVAAARGAQVREAVAAGAATVAESEARLPDFSQWGPVTRERMGSLRRAATKTLSLSWRVIPHVTQFDRADITDLEDQRKTLARDLEQEGTKVTVTAIIVRATVSALRKFPRFNASVDEESEEIVYKHYMHIGVAVDTERGLVVPVIRDADRKTLRQLAVELAELAERARGRKLAPDDMSGAGFTVSNLGGLGTTYFTPIVTWPQVAVLGVGRAEIQAVYRQGEFVPRRILPLSISYDHRLIDGADAARFLRWIAVSLETPLQLLLEG